MSCTFVRVRRQLVLGVCLLCAVLLACSRQAENQHDHSALAIARRVPELARYFNEAAASFRATARGFETEHRLGDQLSAEVALDGTLVVRANSAFPIELRLVGARSSTPRLEGRHVVFERVLTETDLIVASDGLRVEELVFLASATAPHELDWTIALPEGARVDPEGEGLVVHDIANVARARIEPPFLVDAQGTRRAARLVPMGDGVRISFDPQGLVYPVLLDPTITKPVWSLVSSNGPRIRDGAMTYHAGRQRFELLFVESEVLSNGQWRSDPVGPQHWEWSKASGWSRLGAAAPPLTVGARPAIVYDASRNRLIAALGGWASYLSVFEWDGSTWSDNRCNNCSNYFDFQSIAGVYHAGRSRPFFYADGVTFEWAGSMLPYGGTSPPDRAGAAMAYDAARGKVVLYGGLRQFSSTPSIRYTDTWEFDTAWRKITDAGPPHRTYASMAYDEARKRVVLHGGYDGATVYGDTWEWDGTSWTQASVTGPGAARKGDVIAYHPVERKVFSFGGGPEWWSSDDHPAPLLSNELWAYQVYGQACTVTSQCNGDYVCQDGICCTSTCGTCQRCDVATAACITVRNAVDDSCTGTNACDPSGACKKILGQPCVQNAECTTNNCVDNVCCDSPCNGACDACGRDGRCAPLPKSETGSPSCAPYACSGTSASCATSCTDDSSCVAAAHCKIPAGSTTGTCVPDLAPGSICTSSSQCASGACIDGYCCNSTCSGGCSACSVANGASANGTCTILPKGAAGTPSCSPFLCGGAGACPTTCIADTDCISESRCVGGTCIGKRPQGAVCAVRSDCATGNCVDGVCCDAVCDGQCEACNVDIALGTCTAIANLPPQGDRPACPPAPEGRPCEQRICDGKSRAACNGYVGSGVACGEAICKADTDKGFTASAPGVCAGDGSCAQPSPVRCEPFACDATECKTSCAGNTDCTEGYICDPTTKKCLGGTHCKDDVTEVTTSGKERDCKPFRCQNNRCVTDCTTSDDCTAGFFCSGGDGQCKPLDSGGGASGCAARPLTGRDDGYDGYAGLALFALVGLVRRRRGGAGIE